MSESFFINGPVCDTRYAAVRDDELPMSVAARAFVEQIWREAGPYLDSDLREKARWQWRSAYWELYATHALLRNGVALVPRVLRMPRKKGPDLLIHGSRVWIEAVTLSEGQGLDRAVEPRIGTPMWVNEDSLTLRILTALDSKAKGCMTYRAQGVIEANDACVVAIGAGGLKSAYGWREIPRVVRAVYGLGEEQYEVDLETSQVVGWSIKAQDQVAKRSGETVSMRGFLDSTNSDVAGILYAWADEINRPPAAGPEFVFVNNPNAARPVSRGLFPFGREFWMEGDLLHRAVHE